MAERRTLRLAAVSRALTNVGLCLALAAVGVAAVRATWLVLGGSEPQLDLTERVHPIETAAASAGDSSQLRFAVATMVSAEATFSTYRHLVQHVCRQIGRSEAFVVRPSYADVRRALERGEVDVALVCTGTYVHALPGGRVKLLVQPEFEDGLQYRCAVIVPADSKVARFEDLRGRVMAFTDRESNTGYLVPVMALRDRGLAPGSLFAKVLFTGSHDRSILAVASSYVDAAAVDSLVWQSKLQEEPSLADRARVVWHSEPFGPPPVVTPASISGELERALRESFLTMHLDEQGRQILSALGIRRFVPARPESYGSAIALGRRFRQEGDVQWP